jgi:hypothetical protein
MSELSIPIAGAAATTAIAYETGDAVSPTLILGHGAGAGQRSAFLVDFARALAALGIETITFNFPYTEARRRIPDRPAVLEACYRAVVAHVRDRIGDARPLCIGGKSMGGRIATQVAAADPSLAIDGLVVLGYPLHPPGKPDQRRDKHLTAIRRPMLIVQGSRDSFGTPPEFEPILRGGHDRFTLHVASGGDHSFKLSRRDARAQAALYEEVQQTIVRWIETVTNGRNDRTA